MLAAGCAVPDLAADMRDKRDTRDTRASPLDAKFVAADDDFYVAGPGVRAPARLEAINGVSTGAWRLHRGAGTAQPGPVNLLVLLWSEGRLLAAADAAACIRFQAEPQTSYAVTSAAVGRRLVVSVHNTSFNPSQKVADFEVEPGAQATPQTCGRPG